MRKFLQMQLPKYNIPASATDKVILVHYKVKTWIILYTNTYTVRNLLQIVKLYVMIQVLVIQA